MRFLKARAVELVHERQIRDHGGKYGTLDAGRLDAICGRASQRAHYDPDADVFDLAALYLEGIAHDHPFQDGNKRTAWVACRTFLRLNDNDIDMPAEKVIALVLSAATRSLAADAIAKHLREYARKKP